MTLPTVSTMALMTSLVKDAHEGRDVGIFDIPGAYMHVDMPLEKCVLLMIEGQFEDIMCEVNVDYINDVQYENSKKVLYLQITSNIDASSMRYCTGIVMV